MTQNNHALLYRLNILWIMIYLMGGVLGARLVQLQLIQNVEYRLAAERNRTQMIYQTAPRGRIYDRNGIIVATNQPAFSLIYFPPKKDKDKVNLGALARDLARELHQDPESLLATLNQAVHEESAIRLAENLPSRTMFRLSELETIYPGVTPIVEARRYYPFGDFASHLIGYMGKMDPRSWKELKNKGYRVDSRIGKMGLENIFERELRGKDGGIRIEVDAQGRMKGILETLPWEPGSNIHLTLDADVQKAADEGLAKSPTRRGAAVALDPRTGAILAIASAPSFDPNVLLSSDAELMKKTVATLPEFNHAVSGVYPPGSTFKLVVSAAGLNESRLDTSEAVYCPGYFELGKKIFLCWNHKGHKRVSWLGAFKESCDVYFYRMGLKIGAAPIEKYARLFGLGTKTAVALKGEKAGHLFGPETRASAGRSWYDGDTVNLSIGQGELLVTPIQMAVVTAAMANRGILWRPHYTDRIEYAEGQPEYKQAPEKMGTIQIQDRTWDLIQEAMKAVVSSGTGVGAQIPGIDVRGKTGTAQNPGEDHAWFVAYAARPGEAPSIAVAVIVENGGHGGTTAVPIARAMITAALKPEDAKPKPGPALPSVRPLPAVPARTL